MSTQRFLRKLSFRGTGDCMQDDVLDVEQREDAQHHRELSEKTAPKHSLADSETFKENLLVPKSP